MAASLLNEACRSRLPCFTSACLIRPALAVLIDWPSVAEFFQEASARKATRTGWLTIFGILGSVPCQTPQPLFFRRAVAQFRHRFHSFARLWMVWPFVAIPVSTVTLTTLVVCAAMLQPVTLLLLLLMMLLREITTTATFIEGAKQKLYQIRKIYTKAIQWYDGQRRTSEYRGELVSGSGIGCLPNQWLEPTSTITTASEMGYSWNHQRQQRAALISTDTSNAAIRSSGSRWTGSCCWEWRCSTRRDVSTNRRDWVETSLILRRKGSWTNSLASTSAERDFPKAVAMRTKHTVAMAIIIVMRTKMKAVNGSGSERAELWKSALVLLLLQTFVLFYVHYAYFFVVKRSWVLLFNEGQVRCSNNQDRLDLL